MIRIVLLCLNLEKDSVTLSESALSVNLLWLAGSETYPVRWISGTSKTWSKSEKPNHTAQLLKNGPQMEPPLLQVFYMSVSELTTWLHFSMLMVLNWWRSPITSMNSITALWCLVKRELTSNHRSKTLNVQKSNKRQRNPREHLPMGEEVTVLLPRQWDKRWEKLLIRVPKNSIKTTERITKSSETSKLKLHQLCRLKLKPLKILARENLLTSRRKLKKLHSVIGVQEISANRNLNQSNSSRHQN